MTQQCDPCGEIDRRSPCSLGHDLLVPLGVYRACSSRPDSIVSVFQFQCEACDRRWSYRKSADPALRGRAEG